jgi:hypothetical protein
MEAFDGEHQSNKEIENMFLSSVFTSLHYVQNSKRARSEDIQQEFSKIPRMEDLHVQNMTQMYNQIHNEEEFIHNGDVIIGRVIPMNNTINESKPKKTFKPQYDHGRHHDTSLHDDHGRHHDISLRDDNNNMPLHGIYQYHNSKSLR